MGVSAQCRVGGVVVMSVVPVTSMVVLGGIAVMLVNVAQLIVGAA